MKKLSLTALIMVLALSGCASSGTGGSIKWDWVEYWKSPEAGSFRESIKRDWADYWKSPEGGTFRESIKWDWKEYWN